MCKETDELIIGCSEVVMCDADMCQVKQDFSELVSSASENVSSVTISSVFSDAKEAHDERTKEIKQIKDKCRDTGARFVDNDQNFLFRDGSCDKSAFPNDGVHLSTCGEKRLMCNLSLAASKHREDAAQRGSISRGAAIHQDRLAEGHRNRTDTLRIVVPRRRGPQYVDAYWQKAAETADEGVA